MNAIVKANNQPQTVMALVPQNMDQALRFAEMMSVSKMLPKHLQNDVGTCFMVVEQSMRWNMSPFAVAQCTSNIGGKLMYEGKLVAAVASACNGIVGEFDYAFAGDPLKPETLSVTASATRTSDGQRKSIVLKWIDAKTTNEFWNKQPEQQLCYAAARVWCRRWSPGTMLGVYSPEEFDAQPAFSGTTLEAEPPPARTTREQINAAVPLTPRQPAGAEAKQTTAEFLDEVAGMLSAADTADQVDAIAALPRVQGALTWMKPELVARLNEMVARALERTMPGGMAEEHYATSSDDVPFAFPGGGEAA